MADFEKIEIRKTKCGYTAIVDDKFASELCPGEALEVVASALFGPRPVYVQTYEAQLERWVSFGRPVGAPAGLLAGPEREGRGCDGHPGR